MSRLLLLAWLLPALWAILYAAITAIIDLDDGPTSGRSWCLDCRDGLSCDCGQVTA